MRVLIRFLGLDGIIEAKDEVIASKEAHIADLKWELAYMKTQLDDMQKLLARATRLESTRRLEVGEVREAREVKPANWSGIKRELEKRHKVVTPESEVVSEYWKNKTKEMEDEAGIMKELDDASQVG